MKEPKFKYGDKVTGPQGSFQVSQLGFDTTENDFRYWGQKLGEYEEGEWGFRPMTMVEKLLKLYQEPKKKKLYAYSINDNEIRFTDSGIVELTKKEVVRRRPEFDIEYKDNL